VCGDPPRNINAKMRNTATEETFVFPFEYSFEVLACLSVELEVSTELLTNRKITIHRLLNVPSLCKSNLLELQL
jgi:hypothetical protein